MPAEQNEIERVLEALDRCSARAEFRREAATDAALVIRELAADFAHFAPYVEAGVRDLCPDPSSELRRLYRCKTKWRLPS